MLVPAHLSYPSLVFIGAAKLLSVEYSFSDLLILMAASTVPDLDYFFCILKSKLSKQDRALPALLSIISF